MTMPQLAKLKIRSCLKSLLRYQLLNNKILQVKRKKIQHQELEMQLLKKLKHQSVLKKRLKNPFSSMRRLSCLQLSTPSSIIRILNSWRASFKTNTMEKPEVQLLTKLKPKTNSMTTVKEKEDGVRVKKADVENNNSQEGPGLTIQNSVTTLTLSSCRMTLVEITSER